MRRLLGPVRRKRHRGTCAALAPEESRVAQQDAIFKSFLAPEVK